MYRHSKHTQAHAHTLSPLPMYKKSKFRVLEQREYNNNAHPMRIRSTGTTQNGTHTKTERHTHTELPFM